MNLTGVQPAVVDLHLHTTASDGVMTPTQIIDLVAGTSLRVVAITDHDSTNGIDEAFAAAAHHPELSVIPGIELGTEEGESEVHLVGYFFEESGYRDPGFQDALRRLRDGRVIAAERTVARLHELGVDISWDRVRELAGGAVGRPHIARAMAEAGYVSTPQEAFRRYLGTHGIARVKREKPTPAEGVRFIHAAGGACAIAHPQTVKHLSRVLGWLVDEGLDGYEVFAPKYGDEDRDRALETAQRHGLIPTGGTDYHAFGTGGEIVPGAPGVVGPPLEVVDLLRQAAAYWTHRSAQGVRSGGS